MNKTTASLLGLLAVIVLFVSVNVVSGAMLRSARIDLTENKLFTLDQGTRNILRELETPIVLRYYYSINLEKELGKSAPGLRDYARRVRELLEEYEARSNGKIELRVLDPEPFSEEEDRAVASGLQGLPANAAGERFYLGLVASNDIGGEEVIAFLDPRREVFLEYDLTKIIYQLSAMKRPRVGVISSLQIEGAPQNPMQPQQQQQPPWFFLESLRQLFEVETIRTSATQLPSDLDVLVLIHPRGLAPGLQFSIDQFVLGGGRVVAFLDPYCEAQNVPQDPNNPLSGAMADRASELGPLLAAWGVALDKEKIVADRPNSWRVRHPQTGAPIEYVVYLKITDALLSEGDPITAELKQLNFITAGALRALPGATTTFTPLIQTGEESMLLDRMSIVFGPDPERLLQEYSPSGEGYTLAARVSGTVQTAFPGGPPGTGLEDDVARAEMLTRSSGPVNLLIVSDADLLADRWWVEVMRMGAQRIAMPTANNADLLVNAVENLSGNADLISLRSRRSYQRPFDRIADLRRAAEDRHRAEEQRLQARLKEAEQAINDLQAQREGSVSAIILTPQQRAEIEKFKAEQADTRKKLREVQRQLRTDIDHLTLRMKLVNVLGVPSLVALAGLLALAYRHLRRS
jgi:ABC-type uncharacterized transport system involved in gliding motility auxiliary subunit